MANTNAQIDENYQKVALAVDDDGYTKPLLVEPILGYLEIDLLAVSSYTDATPTGEIDDNRIKSSLGRCFPKLN